MTKLQRATPEYMRAKFKKADVCANILNLKYRWLEVNDPLVQYPYYSLPHEIPGPCQYQLPGPAVPSEVKLFAYATDTVFLCLGWATTSILVPTL